MAFLHTSGVLESVITQHIDEASFQWVMRRQAVIAADHTLDELVVLDQLIQTHLKGILLAGEKGWELCQEALGPSDGGEAFVLTIIACQSRTFPELEAIFDCCDEDPELLEGMISAFSWFPLPRIRGAIEYFLASEKTAQQYVALAACVALRVKVDELTLQKFLASECQLLKTAAINAIGYLNYPNFKGSLPSYFREAEYAFVASRSAVFLGDNNAIAELKKITLAEGPRSEDACVLATRFMAVENKGRWCQQLLQQSTFSNQRMGVIAMGAMGDPMTVPLLIEIMQNPELARIAAESISMITGVHLEDDDLEGSQPEGFESGPNDDPEDEDVDIDPDEDLIWPNVNAITEWWGNTASKYIEGEQYLAGKNVTEAGVGEVLRTGTQKQRLNAAFEMLRIKGNSAPFINVKAPGWRQ